MVWYFIGVYIINRTLHGRLEIRNFSSRVEKIFHSFAIFFNTSNTTSPRGHVISSNSFSELALQSHHLLISVYLLQERGTNDIYLARNPNFQVVITHASQVFSQHSFGIPLRMNGTYRTQLDYSRLDLLSFAI